NRTVQVFPTLYYSIDGNSWRCHISWRWNTSNHVTADIRVCSGCAHLKLWAVRKRHSCDVGGATRNRDDRLAIYIGRPELITRMQNVTKSPIDNSIGSG